MEKLENFEIDILDKLIISKIKTVEKIEPSNNEMFFKQRSVISSLTDIRYKLEEMRNK